MKNDNHEIRHIELLTRNTFVIGNTEKLEVI
jgi:hypothetical protein